MSGLGDYGDNVSGGHSLARVYINFNYYLQLYPAHTPVLSQTPPLSFFINCVGITYNLPPSSPFLVFIFILLFLQLRYSQFKCLLVKSMPLTICEDIFYFISTGSSSSCSCKSHRVVNTGMENGKHT